VAALVAELAQPGFLLGLASFPPSAVLLAGAAVLQVLGLLAVRRLARVTP
jgi:Flp pilus assembly protein TadB